MAGKWSASRVGCFSGCPLRYKFQYIQKLTRYPDSSNEFAKKGLSVHETIEKYHSGMSRDELFAILAENVKKYEVDEEKYPVKEGIEKFLIFWNTFIEPKLNDGYKAFQETWVNGLIAREPFCGALDLCLEKDDPDSPIYITDWKTGKSMNPDSYKNQLVLYAYLKGMERGWTKAQIAEKIKLIIFYPLGVDYNLNKSGNWETLSLEEKALKCAKEIVFNEEDIREIIDDYYIQNILKINQIDWENLPDDSGNLGHDCAYCPFAGAKPNPEINFCGCKKSLLAEVEFPEGFEVVTSEEYKKRKENETKL